MVPTVVENFKKSTCVGKGWCYVQRPCKKWKYGMTRTLPRDLGLMRSGKEGRAKTTGKSMWRFPQFFGGVFAFLEIVCYGFFLIENFYFAQDTTTPSKGFTQNHNPPNRTIPQTECIVFYLFFFGRPGFFPFSFCLGQGATLPRKRQQPTPPHRGFCIGWYSGFFFVFLCAFPCCVPHDKDLSHRFNSRTDVEV